MAEATCIMEEKLPSGRSFEIWEDATHYTARLVSSGRPFGDKRELGNRTWAKSTITMSVMIEAMKSWDRAFEGLKHI